MANNKAPEAVAQDCSSAFFFGAAFFKLRRPLVLLAGTGGFLVAEDDSSGGGVADNFSFLDSNPAPLSGVGVRTAVGVPSLGLALPRSTSSADEGDLKRSLKRSLCSREV